MGFDLGEENSEKQNKLVISEENYLNDEVKNGHTSNTVFQLL